MTTYKTTEVYVFLDQHVDKIKSLIHKHTSVYAEMAILGITEEYVLLFLQSALKVRSLTHKLINVNAKMAS